MSGLRGRLVQAASVFGTVLRSRPLRRIEAAFAGFSVAELASWVAILVFAFQHGGATEAGELAVVQLAPSAVVAPLAAAWGDRYRRDRYLRYGYVLQAGAMGATGVLMAWHAPVLAVCVALGMLAHVAGDMCTHDGCPLLYPLSRHEFGLLPAPIRITTNKLAEHWIVSPLLLAGLAYFLWRDAGPSLLAAGPG